MAALESKAPASLEAKKQRMKNALWGVFIADALSCPVHWYYNRDNIKKDFGDDGITKYEDCKHPHPESFMVGMTYQPDMKSAHDLGRLVSILPKESLRFYTTTQGLALREVIQDGDAAKPEFKSTERESEHGNAVPVLSERFHYHHGLKAGDITLNAQLVRVLMRNLVKQKTTAHAGYWIDDFIEFMTSRSKYKCVDPYSEVYIRRWFENYSRGVPPERCAAAQEDIWSIGSHGGVIRPLITGLRYHKNLSQALGMALTHQITTHISENVSTAITILLPLLFKLLDGEDWESAIKDASAKVHLPAITGKDLLEMYKSHKGPGNIPKREMYALHTEFKEEAFDPFALNESMTPDEVIRHYIGTICYVEHGVPLILYLMVNNKCDFVKTLLLNANSGGDNCNRGQILGLLVGATLDKESDIPIELKEGLTHHKEIAKEIQHFVDLVFPSS